MSDNTSNFVNLNAGGRWPGFHWVGLERLGNGSLQLYSLPLLDGELTDTISELPPPDGPAGIAIDKAGNIYYSDPAGDRIMRIDACTGNVTPVPCIGQGGVTGGLCTPRGLAIPRHRNTLFVADSGNHRVQGIALDSYRVSEVWGQASASGEPEPSNRIDGFDTPWDVAADLDGNVYVVDYGNRRVQKYNRAGELVPSFWNAMRRLPGALKPAGVALNEQEGEANVYVLDLATRSVFAFDAEGHPRRDANGNPVQFGSPWLVQPLGLAATPGAVYVGDNTRGRVLKFVTGTYEFAGEAVGYDGPVAALAALPGDRLLVHTGTNLVPVSLNITGGYRTRGVLWSDVIAVREFPVQWHRVQAVAETIGPRPLLRLFVHTSNDPADAPAAPDLNDIDPFYDPKWKPAAESIPLLTNLDDLFVRGNAAQYIWIGAFIAGDGRSTPLVSQLRLEFNHETYLKDLPAIYRNDSGCADFIRRFVSLFETFFAGVEAEIEDLSILFDPAVVPKQYLPWLAGWLALELDEDWDEAMQRQMIARAFEMYGRRGTPEGLREALRLFAGVDAVIEEPIQAAAWWALPAPQTSCQCEQSCEGACGCAGPCGCKGSSRGRETVWDAGENSVLGVTTMLAPAHPQGAVVGTTATLDRSHLITDEEFGLPLFEDVAHQFTVRVYSGQLGCPEKIDEVRRVLDAEKPAHTAYHLCVVNPGARVGYRAALGIDAVVGGLPELLALGQDVSLGKQTALGGQPPGQLGIENRVGITTRVG